MTPDTVARALRVGSGLVGQLLAGTSGFVYSILLVRQLGIAEFGAYALAFAVALTLMGFANAFVVTQTVVGLPDRPPRDRLPFCFRMLCILGCIAAGLLIAGASIPLMWAIAPCGHDWARLGLPIAFASTGMAMREFSMKLAYSLGIHWVALAVSTLQLLVLVLVPLAYPSMVDSPATALAFLGAATLVSGLLGVWLVGLPLERPRLAEILATVCEIRRDGSRSALAHMVISVRTQAHNVLVATALGPAGVGAVNAARLFVAPALLFLPAVSSLALPVVARARAGGTDAALAHGRRILLILVASAFAYAVPVYFFRSVAEEWLTGESAGDLGALVVAWIGVLLATAACSGMELLVIALKRFDLQFRAHVAGSLVALGFVYVLVLQLGELGAIAGLLVSEVTVALFLSRWIRRHE